MKKKRMIAFGMAVFMLFSSTACGNQQIASQNLMQDVTNSSQKGQVNNNNGSNDDKATGLTTEDTSKHGSSEQVPSCDGDRPLELVEKEMQDAAVTDFAVRLFQRSMEMEMKPGSKIPNILISPISVFMALSMTANGADGETLGQMEEVLGMSVDNLNAYAMEYLKNLPNGKKYKLHMANSIWFRDEENRLTVKEDFLQKNKDFYGADVYKSPFDDTTVRDINLWVEEKTDGMIDEILEEISYDTVMYLINALSFDAKWLTEYKSNDVWAGKFHLNSTIAQDVEMLHSEERTYLEDELATGVMKYYADKKYAFVALLPKEGVNLYQYVNSLTGEHLQELLANAKNVTVDTTIPKFEVEYETEMSKILEYMGMTDAFDGGKADLTRMGSSTRGNLFLNRVLHKTFLTLDELGTKAGAVTVVEVNDECAMIDENRKQVTLDRPFFYMIIDCENNQPIFMGTVQYVKEYESDTLCSYPLKEYFE